MLKVPSSSNFVNISRFINVVLILLNDTLLHSFEGMLTYILLSLKSD